jgi:hypothetical protein
MPAKYHVWDDVTGNVVATCGSQREALVFLREMLHANGIEGVRDLAVVEYPADGSDPHTVLEGAELLAKATMPA